MKKKIDASGVKGEWIKRDGRWVCNVCGSKAVQVEEYLVHLTRYCPECGAKLIDDKTKNDIE